MTAHSTPHPTSRLLALRIDANGPPLLARFWAGLLGRETIKDPYGGIMLPAGDAAGLAIRFVRTEEPKTLQNRAHFDMTSSSLDDQQRTVGTALGLGARHFDVGQRPEEGHVVLADPEDNEFCVIEPGNRFLEGCGFIGALSCDGSQAVGYFWSAALGWPLVWDQDQETAIRSPLGGPKITWGGPPLMPRAGRDRLRLDLALPAGGDLAAECERLATLGANRVDDGGHPEAGGLDEGGGVAMTDPDGTEFCVFAEAPGGRTLS